MAPWRRERRGNADRPWMGPPYRHAGWRTARLLRLVGCRFGYRLTQVALDANVTSRSTPRCALHGMPQSGSMRMPQTRGLPRSPSTRRTIRFTSAPGIRCGNGETIPLTTTTCSTDGTEHGRQHRPLDRDFGQPGGRRYFHAMTADQLSNTIIVSSATTALRPAFRWKNTRPKSTKAEYVCR